jgi:hypothetical protein
MLNSGSCEQLSQALERDATGRLESLTGVLQGCTQGEPEQARLAGAAQDFASLFYGMLVKEMLKNMSRMEEDGHLADGVRGMLGMFLPQAISQCAADPVARYIMEQVGMPGEGGLDERA